MIKWNGQMMTPNYDWGLVKWINIVNPDNGFHLKFDITMYRCSNLYTIIGQ